MSAIEPGDRFFVGYGNGHKIEVVALSMRQRREVVKGVETVAGDSKAVDAYDAIEEALKRCCPNITDEIIEKLDEEMAMQIIQATMQKAALSEDDKKKSESPH